MNQRDTDDTKSVAGRKFDSGTCLASISRSASFLEGARVTRSRRQCFAMRGGRWKIFKGQNHVWLEEHWVYHRDANGRVTIRD
jgi:hypothetical protein